MDLSKLSNADLEAIANGDMSAMSDYGLRVISGEEIKKPSIGKEMMESLPVGTGEAALQMLTGIPASAVAGLGGLFGLATGSTTEEAAKRVQDIQSGLTYQPRTEMGKTVSEYAAMPFELAGKGAGYIGGKIGGMFGPKGEAAGETIGEITPAIAATLYAAKAPVKSIATTKFQPPRAPDIPIVSDALRGARDVVRTRTQAGPQKLAEEYLRGLTTAEEAPKTIAALERRGQPIVPESPITSADAIARANREMMLKGQPERFGGQYVALQEGLAKVPETSGALQTTKLLQEKARADVMAKGAGTERAYSTAELARKTNAAPLYKQLTESNAIVDTAKTVNLIDRIIEAKPGNKTLVSAMDDVKSSLIEIDPSLNIQNLRTNPGQLQSAIENINIMMSKQENLPVRRQLIVVKKSLENQINKVEPSQGMASRQYALDSVPLDRMDLWSKLKEKFITPSGNEAPGSYLNALRDETKLIKQATGFKRGESVANIFNKEESALAARLAAEMEMELVKKRMTGEVSMPGIGKAAEGLEPKLPNMLMRETMVANFIIRTLAKDANVAVNIAAANILKDPKALAGVLKQVKPDHRSSILKSIREASVSKEAAVLGGALQGQQQ